MKLQINIDGKQYEADIEVLEDERPESGASTGRPMPRPIGNSAPPPAAAAPKPAAPPAPASSASGNKVCKSTIVGIVVKVLVQPGQAVNSGDTLVVLEAMKMESNVSSPVSGKVKAIFVNAGDSVKKGQVMVEFE
ncbi:MAG: biotin/lipoyl-binding protein [Polyangiaceae bacterium]